MLEMMATTSASFEKVNKEGNTFSDRNSRLTNGNTAPAPAEDDEGEEYASTNLATAVSMSPEQEKANGDTTDKSKRRGKYDRDDEDRDDGGISGPTKTSNKRQSSSLLSATASKKVNDGDSSCINKKPFYVVCPGGEGDALKGPIIFYTFQDLQLFYDLMGVEMKRKTTPTTSTDDSKFDDAEEENPEDESLKSPMHYKAFDNHVDAMEYANKKSNNGDGGTTKIEIEEGSSSPPHKRQKKAHKSEGGDEESGGNEQDENPLAVAARIRTKEAAERESLPDVPSKLQQLEERQIQNLQNEYDRKFQRKLQELKFFKEEYGHIDIPSISTPLREWLNQQRQLYAELVQQQQLQPHQENGAIPLSSKWNPLKLEHILALTSLGFNIMMTPLPPQPPQAPAALAHLHHHVPPQYHAAAFASAAAASTLLAAGGHPPPTVGYPHVPPTTIHDMMTTPGLSAATAAAAAAGRMIRETSQASVPSSADTSPTAAAAGAASVSRQHAPAGNHNSQWSEQEDAIIFEAVTTSQEQPFTRWSDLARNQLPNRKGKQIRDRWVNQLNPNITKTPFTSEDDMTLWNAHEQCGKRWVEISSKFFDGRRSENQVKNRWYSAAFQKFITANNITSKSSSDKKDSAESSSSSSNTKEV